MTDINLNIPFARIIPEKAIKRFTTHLLEPDNNGQKLSPGAIVADRYEIVARLPDIGKLRCYSVSDHLNTSRCAVCGMENNANATSFCDWCGYYLADGKFLLLEGKQSLTAGFEPVIRNGLNHQGILKFFDKFYYQENYYIIGQCLENKTLSSMDCDIQFFQVLNWIIILLESLELLHSYHIFNVSLSSNEIFLLPDRPRLVNFANSVEEKTNVNQWIQSDIKNLAKTFLLVLSEIKPEDKNVLDLKRILTKAIQGGYHKIVDFIDEIIQHDQKLERPEQLDNDKKTVLLTDKGVSISVGMASDVGIVRRLNEDSVGAFELTSILQSVCNPYGFYMVADGMGGHEAGEEASKIAVEHVTRKIIRSFNNTFEPVEEKAREILKEAVFSANQEIYEIARAKNSNMGTTITIAYLINDRALILNIGDGRAYLYSNKKLELITQDHSLVFRLYKIGQLKYEDIYQHPQSNQILCALGEQNLPQSLDNLAERANHPYFFNIRLKKGDGLLLCTDGLWQMIRDSEMEQILTKHSHPQSAVDELVSLANKNGGDDNISLIFVKTQ